MKAIWKYEIAIRDACSIEMPEGAKILSVREQFDAICLWAFVDTDAICEVRNFVLFGTGEPIPDGESLQFLGTAHLNGGVMVFHVAEVISNKAA